MKYVITGGAGFIGSAVIRHILHDTNNAVVNVDKLTYASNPAGLADLDADKRYAFAHVDIRDRAALDTVFQTHQPDAVMHLAAESHVDRSIHDADTFIQTNIVGTGTLLEASRHYWNTLPPSRRQRFRFHHVSTDEVHGDTDREDHVTHAYAPSSPYSASKAGADHLVQAWRRTYGLPTLITHSSNAYGPGQHAEKLIPNTIRNALAGRSIPVYGDGRQRRNWLYVDDLARALCLVINQGDAGANYDIGACIERSNIDVIHRICEQLDALYPESPHVPHSSLITHVADRPGHDYCYAMAPNAIRNELGWSPQLDFPQGLRNAIMYYASQHPESHES